MGIYIGDTPILSSGGGKSPYEVAKENGYTGTEAEFNAALVEIDDYASVYVGEEEPTEEKFWIKTDEGGEGSLVSTFNGRSGEVVPESGDYTAEMVGAVSKSGDTMTGSLKIKPSQGSNVSWFTSHEDRAIVANHFDDNNYQHFRIGKDGVSFVGMNNGAWFDNSIYHTGNKPTYTDVGAAPAGYVDGYYDIRDNGTLIALLDMVYSNMPSNTRRCIMIADNGATAWGGGTYTATIDKSDDDYGVVDLVSYNHYGSALRISKYGGIWQGLEWENPPMEFGEEYRTTERYMGKPVYVKACNFGALPNAATASASLGFSATAVIYASGVNSVGEPFPMGATTSAGSIDIYVNRHGGCWITTTTDHSSETATIIVKYIKD